MSEFFTVLTSAGEARIANAIATNTTLNVSHVAVGDGNGAPVAVIEGRVALVGEVYRAPINTLAQDPVDLSLYVAELVIPSEVGGWTIREVGLFDDAGTLLAYGNFPESYKPVIAEGSAKELVVRMYMRASAGASIQLKIDPTVVLSTRAWVLSQIKAATRISRPATYFIAQI